MPQLWLEIVPSSWLCELAARKTGAVSDTVVGSAVVEKVRPVRMICWEEKPVPMPWLGLMELLKKLFVRRHRRK